MMLQSQLYTRCSAYACPNQMDGSEQHTTDDAAQAGTQISNIKEPQNERSDTNQTNKKAIQALERTLTTAPSHSSQKGNQPITSTFDNTTVTITRGTGQ